MDRQDNGGKPRRAVAGRSGVGIRSDIRIEIETNSGPGIQLQLESRVEAYYGDSIRRQVEERITAIGLEHARVMVQDSGALPFVIDARVEAAARRAGATGETALRPRQVGLPAASPRDRLRRSRLYLPGNEPHYFINAGLHGADGVILDLEDSVHPDEKDAARILVRNALREVDFGGSERMLRINPLPLGLEDLESVVAQFPDVILIPKVEEVDQVREIDEAIGRLADGDRPVWLMPILESALGIERSFEIARSSPRIVALTLGLEDYAADLGLPKSVDGDESFYARTRVVNAARAAGLQPIDSVYGQLDDLGGLEAWAAHSRSLGFVGMGCVHPGQIEVIHRTFNPTPAEIERAVRIVSAFEAAREQGLGVVSLGSKMIDPPVIKQAQRIVRLAREVGLEVEPSRDLEQDA